MLNLKAFLGLAAFISLGALAGPVDDEVRRLQKCYGIFVGERILKSDPLFVSVSSGLMNGTDACMNLLDRAKLGQDGKIQTDSSGVPDQVGHKILLNLVEYQRNEMQNPDYFATSGAARVREIDVFDTNEPALHFVYALVKPGEPYSGVVTRSQGIRALRYSARGGPRKASLTLNRNVNAGNFVFFQGPTGGSIPWNPTLIETGQLMGMIPETVQNVVSLLESGIAIFQGRNANAHFGGGFIGSQAYFHASNNNRLWATNVLSDAMCKDIPVLRSIDVVNSVIPESTFPWRQGISCMQCHDTMDPLSGAVRARFIIRTSPQEEVRFFVSRAVDKPSAPYPSLTADNDFGRRPADFNLKFRSHDGTLVNLQGTGLPALGALIAEQEDFYACAAKRYFKLLTGIEVDLRDDSDPLNPLGLTPSETKFRNRVLELGKRLKQEQDLKSLVRQIIGSPTFIYPDRGV
jgi:hypothetical protein